MAVSYGSLWALLGTVLMVVVHSVHAGLEVPEAFVAGQPDQIHFSEETKKF